ncbi:MAG: DegT/DnrJ/EryC1/StrS family aminotransferase [Verrucomicrobia bacterium]|nr:DegT/DnrJ/EryC1/StrS family aminotransferase [Verrucomicrobiota bacterium]
MNVPFLNFHETHQKLKPELMAALEETLDSGQFILGAQVDRFEKAYAAMMGADEAVGINSGTSALHLCVRACGVSPRDEVITTPFTFMASSWCINYEKAIPVFADIDSNNYNLDPEKVEAVITEKTKAIVVVHLFGQPAPMDEFVDLAEKYNLKLIEDCAQSHLATYKGKPTGLVGDCGAFSFYPTKNLGGLTEGGLCVSKHQEMVDQFRLLRNHAMPDRYTYSDVGYNYRMEGFAGALLNVKLKHLEEWTERRRAIAAKYLAGLKLEDLRLPPVVADAASVYHQFSICHPQRDALVKHLTDHDVATGLFYPRPLHIQPVYESLDYKEGDFPVVEQTCREIINLPIYPELSDEQVDYVIATFNAFEG